MTQLHELHEYFRISMEKSSFYFKSCISKCPQPQQDNQWWQIPRPATCQWLAMFTPLKSNMELLTTWHTFWCHDKLFDVRCVSYVMTNFCCHEVFWTSWQTFWHHDIFFTSWQTFDVMTSVLRHDVFLILWQTFWHPDELVLVITNVLSSWNLWRHDNVFFKPWRTLWLF